MPVNILGLNHRTAPVALREKVAFTEERLVAALRALRLQQGIAEVLILSTCNRTEVYWAGPASGNELSEWLVRHHDVNLDLAASLYVHQEQQAVEHAFNVASGLDSMVLGETQILGQLKDAYRLAQQSGSTGPELNKLFQAAFAAAKRIRTETRIGVNSVSLASASVSLARRVYADLSARSALMVGAGDMIALTARHFATAGVKRMVIANRTLLRAQTLAEEFSAHSADLTHLDQLLVEADIVISCTASPTALIGKSAAAKALRARRRRPIFMVDLAVPRDIDPAVAELEDVYLFSIDDLQQLVEEHRQQREVAAGGARRLIGEEVARFIGELRSKEAGPAIRALRQQADAIRAQTLETARHMIATGKSPADALDYLATTLTNRLLHAPIQALKQASQTAGPANEDVTRGEAGEGDRQ